MMRKFRVLHIDTEKSWGGGQNQVFLLHKGLLQHSVDSIVMCPPKSSLFAFLRTRQLPVISLNLLNLILFTLAKRPAIVHCHSGRAHYFGIIAKLFWSKAKLIVTRRVIGRPKHIRFKNLFTDAIICISKAIKKELQSTKIKQSKLHLVYSGIEPIYAKVEAPSWAIKTKESEVIIGTVGALKGYKDHYTLIKAFAEFSKNYPLSKLVIIGSGPEESRLKAEVAMLNLQNRVIFTGFLPQAAAYIRFFDVFVITSSYSESLCTSIIDAFFQRVPVVATRVGGVPELVIDEQTGYLADIGDFETIAKRIKSIIENREKTEYLIQNAYKHAQQFSASQMVSNNLALYKKLLGTL